MLWRSEAVLSYGRDTSGPVLNTSWDHSLGGCPTAPQALGYRLWAPEDSPHTGAPGWCANSGTFATDLRGRGRESRT